MTLERHQEADALLWAYYLHLEGIAAILFRRDEYAKIAHVRCLIVDLTSTPTTIFSAIHGQTLTTLCNQTTGDLRDAIHAVDVARIAYENAVNGDPRI